MSDEAPSQPNLVNRSLPGCTIVKTIHVGVSADRTEVVMICETKEQGDIALKIKLDDAAAFSFAAEAARKAANTALPSDQQQVPALVVKAFDVGRTSDISGVLLMVNPRSADEQYLVFPDQAARAAGNALMGAAFNPQGKPSTIIHNRVRGRILDQMGRPIAPRRTN